MARATTGISYWWVIYLALVVACGIIEYPGQLNPDSLDQMAQGLHREFLNDWHSPAVTLLWSSATPVFGQPTGALMIQSALIMLFPAVVIHRSLRQRRAGIKIVLLSALYCLFFVSWIAIAGLILKDATFLGFVSAILALSYDFQSRSAASNLLLAAAAILACLLIRPTNFVIIGFTLLTIGILFTKARRSRVNAIFASLAIAIVAAAANPVINQTGLRAENAHAAAQLMIFDVAGISAATQTDLFQQLPGWPSEKLSRPWACYTPTQWDPFAWGDCEGYLPEMMTVQSKMGDSPVYRWWMSSVLSHPLGYLQHRIHYATALLTNGKFFTGLHPIPENDGTGGKWFGRTYGLDMTREMQIWVNSPAKMAVNAVATAFLRWRALPALSLIACCSALIWLSVARLRPDGPLLVVAIAAAIGLGNVLMLTFFGVSDDDRYLIPTLCCGYVVVFEFWLRYFSNEPANSFQQEIGVAK